MRNRRSIFITPVLAAAGLILLLIGCGGPPVTYDQPVVPMGYYETAWVEPQIVRSDSIFTLIRSARVDSLYVEGAEVRALSSPALEFVIPTDTCFVSMVLQFLESDRNPIPLIVQYLPKGTYKLTITDPLKFGDTLYLDSYQVRGSVCGVRKM
jgi:hypothetical protein